MKHKFAKFLTLLLAAAMITGSLSVTAFADEADVTAALVQDSETDDVIVLSDEGFFYEVTEDAGQIEIIQEYAADQPAEEPVTVSEPVSEKTTVPVLPVQEVSEPFNEIGQPAEESAEEAAAEDESEQAEELPAAEETDMAEGGKDSETAGEKPVLVDVPAGPSEEVLKEDAALELEDEPVTSPDAPKNVSVYNIKEGTGITWDAVTDAEKYVIYRKPKGGTWSQIGETEETWFIDTAGGNGKSYYYAVAAAAGSVTGNGTSSKININPGFVELNGADGVSGGIALGWNSKSGAGGYIVYRKEKGADKWTALTAVTGTSYTDQSAKNGKTYYYTVRSYIKSGNSYYYSAYDDPGLEYTKLAVPKLGSTLNTAKSIRITWSSVAGASSYRVYRRQTGGNWETLGYTEETRFYDTTAKAGVAYYYTVRAYAGSSRSYFQKPGAAGYTLAKVSGVYAYNTKSGVRIQWSALSGAQGYTVYRSTNPEGSWVRLANVTDTSYTDTKAPSGVVYYIVRAYRKVNDVVVRGMYDTEAASIEAIAAPVLGNVTTNKNTPSITIRWSAVAGAAEYRVFRKKVNDSSWTLTGTVTGTSYTDTAVNVKTEYYYTVRAVSASGTLSGYDGAGVFASFNPAPVLVSAVGNPSGVQVKWKAFTGASGYYIYRKVGNESDWTRIGSTTGTTYLDINARAGKYNTYTVRAYYYSGGTQKYSGYNPKGISVKYTDSVRVKAANRLAQVGGTLRAAYNWCANLPYVNRPNGHTAQWYANIAFTELNADCYTKAAAFCWMARELGYNAKVMDGYVPLASGNIAVHGWVEIIINGTTYVFDPEFQQEYPDLNGYMITYGQSNTWKYQNWTTMPDY